MMLFGVLPRPAQTERYGRYSWISLRPKIARVSLTNKTAAQQLVDIGLAGDHALGGGAQPVHFGRIEIERAARVGEGEGVEQRTGPPTGDWGSPPFVVREKLDGGVVCRHHPRCRDYE